MKKKINNLGIILFITIGVIFVVIYFVNENKLKNHHRYTIGTVYKFEGERGGPVANYTYTVNNVKYDVGNTVYEIKKNTIDKIYYVKFYPPNPKNSEILLDKPVSDSIKEAPPEGWDKIPE